MKGTKFSRSDEWLRYGQIFWLINLKDESAYLKTYNNAKVLHHNIVSGAKSPVHQQAQAGAQAYMNQPFIFSVPWDSDRQHLLCALHQRNYECWECPDATVQQQIYSMNQFAAKFLCGLLLSTCSSPISTIPFMIGPVPLSCSKWSISLICMCISQPPAKW